MLRKTDNVPRVEFGKALGKETQIKVRSKAAGETKPEKIQRNLSER